MIFLMSTTLGRSLLAWTASTFSLTLAGPFGTFDGLPLADRLLFWSLATGLSILIGVSAAIWVDRRLGVQPQLLRDFSVASVLTICFTPALYLLVLRFTDGADIAMTPLEMAAIVFSVPFLVGLVRSAIKFSDDAPAETDAPETDAPEPRLFDRIAPDQRGTILSVSVRDHYVDVVTEAGKAEILMRFSDALRELDCVAGQQVHRSHWVADAAVAGVARVRGKLMVTLQDGRHLPVSRTYQQAALSRWADTTPASAAELPEDRAPAA